MNQIAELLKKENKALSLIDIVDKSGLKPEEVMRQLQEAQAAGLPCLISDCVPDACMLTDLVQKVSLEDSAQQWADRILAARATVRRDRYDEIAASGFDIVSNAAWLQQYYIEHWKEKE